MIDIGVNLTSKRFDKDRLDVIERAKQAGISAMFVTGTNVDESTKAVSLCKQFPNYLYSTAGVHPHDAGTVTPNYLEQLQQLATETCVKAIGECGLDFNRNFSTPEQQTVVFGQQIALAAELKLPLFLHQRDAFDTWFAMLQPYVDKVPSMIAHCFTGNKHELLQCINADMYIGITGWLCDERRGKELQDIVQHIPMDKLLIETDAPYLTPRTIRPKPKSSRNEPSYLQYVIATLSSILGYSEQELMAQTANNTRQAFLLTE